MFVFNRVIIYSNWYLRNTNLLALYRMNWLREKIETGILETTVVVKWSDFSGKMRYSWTWKGKDFERECMIRLHDYQICSKRGGFIYLILWFQMEGVSISLKKCWWACRRTSWKRWIGV